MFLARLTVPTGQCLFLLPLPRYLFAIVEIRLRVVFPAWNTNVQELASLRLISFHDDVHNAGHADFDRKICMLTASICLEPLPNMSAYERLDIVHELTPGDTARNVNSSWSSAYKAVSMFRPALAIL